MCLTMFAFEMNSTVIVGKRGTCCLLASSPLKTSETQSVCLVPPRRSTGGNERLPGLPGLSWMKVTHKILPRWEGR
jgi:hypothetical protein